MKFHLKIILLTFPVLFFASCLYERDNKDAGRNIKENSVAGDSGRPAVVSGDTQLLFSENFSQGRKKSYAAGSVGLATGSWLFDDALIGEIASGRKEGGLAARIRNEGRLTMQFDTDVKVSTIEILTETFGGDKTSEVELSVSENGGKSFRNVPEKAKEKLGDGVVHRYHAGTPAGVRFEIRKVSGGKGRITIRHFKAYGGRELHAGRKPDNSSQAVKADKQIFKAGRAEADDSDTLLGNPSRAFRSLNSPDNYLIKNPYYTVSYSRSRACANWASWHISRTTIGNAGRQNDFRPAEILPEGWYRVDERSYRSSGFDKGHNCPSADRTSSKAANSSTFIMYNIIPQAPQNNQNVWEHLETYCRNQVNKGNEAYVIMGSYGKGGTGKYGYRESIDSGRIVVPSHIWKVVLIIPDGNNDLLRISENTRVIAVSTPNSNIVSANWMDYICTVRDIEKATGYNLFSALPENLQDLLENRRFKGGN